MQYTHYIATSEQTSPTSSDHPILPVWLPGPDSFWAMTYGRCWHKNGCFSHELLDAKFKTSISLLDVRRSWYFSVSFDAILQSKERGFSENDVIGVFGLWILSFGTYLGPEVWIGLQAKKNTLGTFGRCFFWCVVSSSSPGEYLSADFLGWFVLLFVGVGGGRTGQQKAKFLSNFQQHPKLIFGKLYLNWPKNRSTNDMLKACHSYGC